MSQEPNNLDIHAANDIRFESGYPSFIYSLCVGVENVNAVCCGKVRMIKEETHNDTCT